MHDFVHGEGAVPVLIDLVDRDLGSGLGVFCGFLRRNDQRQDFTAFQLASTIRVVPGSSRTQQHGQAGLLQPMRHPIARW